MARWAASSICSLGMGALSSITPSADLPLQAVDLGLVISNLFVEQVDFFASGIPRGFAFLVALVASLQLLAKVVLEVLEAQLLLGQLGPQALQFLGIVIANVRFVSITDALAIVEVAQHANQCPAAQQDA
jgi:hypothetical protein